VSVCACVRAFLPWRGGGRGGGGGCNGERERERKRDKETVSCRLLSLSVSLSLSLSPRDVALQDARSSWALSVFCLRGLLLR
jgi:hypothetical protein